ncbi:MAG TPA: helix-turn-helix transcriptional regulator [Candidatus Saccharimonadales bacterium]|nr:helix-turn-helix transcriptional regulator [Candidatus Saccharimonadales bacterium]
MSDSTEAKLLKAFGKRVADIRRTRGMTQEQLAEKANVTPLSIGFIEQGRRWPRLSTLHKLAKCLGVPISDFFRGL